MKNHKSNLLINLILINLCFSLLFSCSGDSSSGKENIIDVENALKNFCVGNLGDYASNIDYIRLETNDSSVLGNITDIFLEKGLLFIADDKDVCRIFDSNGKYIRSINRIGRGPEEYLSIRDMYVSSKTGNIMIMDHSGVITEYSMYGDFIRKIAPPDREKS
ncbi:MAG: 6-bladed beta-propeller, partial [Bacteroidales bacterium]|nr:6-bladed beta-propeller [Bacteroidales bacterium]